MELYDRDFQVWEYIVSHGSLLIRSPIAGDFTNNLDLLFNGVKYVSGPTYLAKLKPAQPNAAEQALADSYVRFAYPFESAGGRFFLVAYNCLLRENEYGPMESDIESKMTRGLPRRQQKKQNNQ